MTEELKPCVWCEHEGVLQCSSDGEVEWVRCVSCGRESPLAYSAEEATRRWNAGEVRDAAPVRLSHSAEKEALIGQEAVSDAVHAALWEADRKVEALIEALEGIYAARLRNGVDHGYGWDIGLLNLAMNVALPLIGKEPPPQPTPEEREEMRAKFQALLDADRSALLSMRNNGNG